MLDFRDADEVEVEWDQEGVAENKFVTIAKGQGIMPTTVEIRQEHHVYIILNLMMRQRTTLP